MKKYLKIFSGLVSICIIIIIVSVISYKIAYKKISEEYITNFEYSISNSDSGSTTVNAEEPPNNNELLWSNDDGNTNIEYYKVKLNENKLSVYIYNNDIEEFMYDIDLNGKHLSSDEKNMLSEGKILYTKGELTGFIENYTS